MSVNPKTLVVDNGTGVSVLRLCCKQYYGLQGPSAENLLCRKPSPRQREQCPKRLLPSTRLTVSFLARVRSSL